MVQTNAEPILKIAGKVTWTVAEFAGQRFQSDFVAKLLIQIKQDFAGKLRINRKLCAFKKDIIQNNAQNNIQIAP